MQWEPGASLETLQQCGLLRTAIREWMLSQSVLEVCTPPLSVAANTEVSIEPIRTRQTSHETLRYLHTSPEFAMKRILAAYPETDIYQIATVFRAEEQGRYHASQFSLLEWYRVGMNHLQLLADVESLLRHVYQTMQLEFPGVSCCSYAEVVNSHLGGWPQELEGRQVQDYFRQRGRSFPPSVLQDLNACLDLFIDEFVLPEFAPSQFTFVLDYPASQAALARISENDAGVPVAERFELYYGQLELANGFHELTDAQEQRHRLQRDVDRRRILGKPHLPIDENFLAALEAGLPDCAGVALGLDRLLMGLTGHPHIANVVCFDDEHA
ncbi:MAG: EF-P lysine aminoacylase EpmA [Granulosicoccus sp.]